MTIDIEPLRKELGRKIEEEDVVTQAPIKAMLATFDREEKVPEPGEPIGIVEASVGTSLIRNDVANVVHSVGP